jgi:MFS family permease
VLRGNRDFQKLWLGQFVSLFGTGLGALPFTAVLVLDASAFEMGLLGAAGMLPGFVAGLPAGAWVDRLRRRPVLIAADAGRAALLAWVFVAAVGGWLTMPQLYVVALGAGVCTVFFDIAYHAYLPSLVEPGELVAANSRLAASASAAEAGSFSVGGWIVQLASARMAVLADAVSYVVSAAAILSIRGRESPGPAASERRPMHREAAEGVRTLLADPVLRGLAAARMVRDLSYGLVGSVILLYGIEELGFEPGALGLIFAVGGVSSIAGAALAGRIAARAGAALAMRSARLVAAAATLLIAAAPGSNLAGVLCLVGQQLFGDSAMAVYEVNEASLRQAITPGRLLGRIEATFQFGGLAAGLSGLLLGGLVGEALGLRTAILLGAAGHFAAVAALVAAPLPGRRQGLVPVRDA